MKRSNFVKILFGLLVCCPGLVYCMGKQNNREFKESFIKRCMLDAQKIKGASDKKFLRSAVDVVEPGKEKYETGKSVGIKFCDLSDEQIEAIYDLAFNYFLSRCTKKAGVKSANKKEQPSIKEQLKAFEKEKKIFKEIEERAWKESDKFDKVAHFIQECLVTASKSKSKGALNVDVAFREEVADLIDPKGEKYPAGVMIKVNLSDFSREIVEEMHVLARDYYIAKLNPSCCLYEYKWALRNITKWSKDNGSIEINRFKYTKDNLGRLWKAYQIASLYNKLKCVSHEICL